MLRLTFWNTNLVSSTIEGEKCIFPYKLNGWPMYFCWYENDTNDFQCPTIVGNQTCASGEFDDQLMANHFSTLFEVNMLI